MLFSSIVKKGKMETTICQLSSEEGRRQLRSADSRTCVVRRTYNNFGDRCFAAASPRL